MNDYENGIITGSIGLGVDYYKGEKGDKPVKGVDYFTQEDIDEIAAQIEAGDIDLSDYAKKEDVEAAIAGITFPTETDPVFTASAAASITPTDISSWNSKSDFSGDYEDLTNKPTIPTKTSDLTNDSDFVAQSELSDYATKDYVEGVIAGVETGMLKRSIVSTLPSSGIDENTIYMVERSESESGNVYDEYMYVGSSWEKIGSTDVDLTDYWKKSDLTFTNGLTESNGTVSWNLFGRIRSGNGERSILEGTATNAGVDAHAEGEYTKANGAASHAEGESTTASGYASHAEGKQTFATQYGAHAEGNYTQAAGNYSHAEGQRTIASGSCAHAEGYWTTATASNSHAEGRYNIEDNNNIFQNIAGNGTADNARSNSFARDWNGNEYLAGNLFVNCSDYTTDANGLTTENAGGSKVATEDYVDQAIADIPTGGGSEYTAGNGIEIDNDTIRTIPFPVFQALFSWNNFYYTDTNNTALIISSTDEGNNAIEELLKGKMILISSAAFSNYTITPAKLGKTTTQLAYVDFDVHSTYLTSVSKAASVNWKNNAYHYYDGNILYIWSKASNKPLPNLLPVKIGTRNVESIGDALQRHENKIGLPTLPSGTNGDYKLTATVADGSTTTQWVEDSGSDSSGSSYTAGNGIDIDSNNVISNTRIAPYGIYGGNGNYYRGRNHTKEEQVKALLDGYILYDPTDYLEVVVRDFGYPDAKGFIVYRLSSNRRTYTETVESSLRFLEYRSFLYGGIDSSGDYVVIYVSRPSSSAADFSFIQSGLSRSGNTYTTVYGEFKNFQDEVNTRIPTAPTADGSYKLTSTTTSGSSTYSWVADSSTTYTAGNGISIDSNGVISLDLSSAEGVGF